MKKVILGKNDLFTVYPNARLKWDYKLNEINPTTIHYGSSMVCYWTCKKRHSYKRAVYIAVKSECPVCKKEKLSIFYKPYIMKFWDYSKNININPKEHFEYETTKAYWKCEKCGYEWRSGINTRKIGLCPCCDVGTSIKSGYNDVTTIVPCLLEDFLQEENPNINLSNIGVADKKHKINWTCHICGYKWASTIFSRTRGHNNKNKINKCPVCGKAKRSISFEKQYPILKNKWNKELNGFDFEQVKGTDYQNTFWWNCNEHGPFQQILSAMIRAINTKTQGCPYCGGKTINKYNSLKLNYPQLFQELSKEDNYIILKNDDVSITSTISLCWTCNNCNEKYYMSPKDRIDFYIREKYPCNKCKGIKSNIEHYL